jgi:FkbM family methyltransferase
MVFIQSPLRESGSRGARTAFIRICFIMIVLLSAFMVGMFCGATLNVNVTVSRTTTHTSRAPSITSSGSQVRPATNEASVIDAPWKPVIYSESSCHIEHVGGNTKNKNYGAWPVCTNLLPSSPLVYSFGIGPDISFDVSMVQDFGAKSVFCYDPTVDKDHFAKLVATYNSSNISDQLHFSQIGIGESNGIIKFFKSENPKIGSLVSTPGLKGYQTQPHITAPVLELSSLVAMNRHEWVDLVKMDVEGAEFDIFSAMLDVNKLPTSQILIEFHARMLPNGFEQQEKIYQKFIAAGWEMAYEQPGSKEEVVFIRVKPKSG